LGNNKDLLILRKAGPNMFRIAKPRRAHFPLATMMPRLEAWFDTDAGQSVLRCELDLIERELASSFGYHLLQISVSRKIRLFETSVVRHKIAASALSRELTTQDPPSQQHAGDVVVDVLHLPFESDSVDVVILHHVLEFSQHPHQLLREASRILAPHGTLIIVGFNPVSLWGVWQAVNGLFSGSLWQNRLINPTRLYDWLTLLDCSVGRVDYGGTGAPIVNYRWRRLLNAIDRFAEKLHLPFGSFYVLTAKKEIASLTPSRPKWPLPKPALRSLEVGVYSHKIKTKHKLH
jgi:SAM-dependent methyltransferase